MMRTGMNPYCLEPGQTGIAQSTLSEFMAGGRGLSMRNLDLLAEYLNLRLTMAGKQIR